jgi:predicted amino acid dehydrogenase
MIEPPSGYFREARKMCRETSTLFVADEIQTGLGRTGAMTICGEIGVTPDILVLAKALGGGLMPIGACVSTREAYNEDFALKHTSTFAGNALACRVGISVLDKLEENDGALLKDVARNGARLKEVLLRLQKEYPGVIRDVRGKGYLLGISFGLDRHSYEEGVLGYLGETEALTALIVGHLLNVESVRVGYTLNQGGVLRIEPALSATWEECRVFADAFERVLRRIERADVSSLTSHVTGFEGSAAHVDTSASRRPRVSRAPLIGSSQDGRFAFLVHPLEWKDYTNLDPKLSILSDAELRRLSTAIADNFDPMVVGETRITALNGKSAYGEFILIPRRPEELQAMDQSAAVEEVLAGARLARDRGASIIGLGAYTSVVTQGGLLLAGNDLPSITTGNSFTAAAARRSVCLAVSDRDWSPSNCAVAILGAGGAVGQATSILLSMDCGSLILLGNPAHPDLAMKRMRQVVSRIVDAAIEVPWRSAPGSVAEKLRQLAGGTGRNIGKAELNQLVDDVIADGQLIRTSIATSRLMRSADIVVSCTNSVERMIQEECVRPSAVVCDVARPSNVCESLPFSRRDVMIADGAVVRLPGSASLGLRTSLAPGYAYACMAETMMLAIEHNYENTSLGMDLPLGRIFELEQLAEDLGFEVVAPARPKIPRSDKQLADLTPVGAAVNTLSP